jgi:hypothetical protein
MMKGIAVLLLLGVAGAYAQTNAPLLDAIKGNAQLSTLAGAIESVRLPATSLPTAGWEQSVLPPAEILQLLQLSAPALGSPLPCLVQLFSHVLTPGPFTGRPC